MGGAKVGVHQSLDWLCYFISQGVHKICMLTNHDFGAPGPRKGSQRKEEGMKAKEQKREEEIETQDKKMKYPKIRIF